MVSAVGGENEMNDILQRLEVQYQSDLHDDFTRTLFAEAAVEIERLHKDAERYRWLRDIPDAQRADHDRNPGHGGWDAPIFWHGINKPGDELQGSDLDAAIDAAMKGANA
jgi:hypothetical protein